MKEATYSVHATHFILLPGKCDEDSWFQKTSSIVINSRTNSASPHHNGTDGSIDTWVIDRELQNGSINLSLSPHNQDISHVAPSWISGDHPHSDFISSRNWRVTCRPSCRMDRSYRGRFVHEDLWTENSYSQSKSRMYPEWRVSARDY
jgi:hypothetical protein